MPTRREFLYLSMGLGIGAVGKTAIDYISTARSNKLRVNNGKNEPIVSDNVQLRKEIPVNYDNAIFRAATLRLSSDIGYGHGSLIKSNGNYYIYTAEHVISDVLKKEKNPKVHIPGVYLFPLLPEYFRSLKKGEKETDTASFYPIPDEYSDILNNAIRQQVITPLTPAAEPPKIGDKFYVPREDRNAYIVYKYTEYNRNKNLLVLNLASPNGIAICKGESGSPIMKSPDSTDVYGILTSGTSNIIEQNTSKECSSNLFARPNGPFGEFKEK